MACRKSILFNDGRVWTKKEKNFDVTMGAQDVAEIAELTGIYLLQQVNNSLSEMEQKAYRGLYRYDRLIYIEDANGPLLNRIEKALHRIFKGNKLSISLEQKGHEVNCLDVTMDTDGMHKPYKKPNSKTTYVSKASNHQPSITKNIPKSIGKRLNTISSSEAEFNNAKDDYQNALSEAGYSDELTDNLEQAKPTRVNKKRKRNIVWFNPPYSRNVTMNIRKEFFNLLEIHFPTQHPLHRLFNRNTIKLSYSCTMNTDSIIKAHNAKILNKEEDNRSKHDKTCNCRDQAACPVENYCLKNNVVYKATVEYDDKKQHYIGMTKNSFKTRYTLHKSSFKHSTKRRQTKLFNLIWKLKDSHTEYKLTWSIIDCARPYQPGKRTCNLCLSEKFHILTGSHLINRKTELLNKCPHRRIYLVCNVNDSSSSLDTQSVILCILRTFLCVYLSVRFLVWIVTIYFVNLVWRGTKYRNGCNRNRIVSLVYVIIIYIICTMNIIYTYIIYTVLNFHIITNTNLTWGYYDFKGCIYRHLKALKSRVLLAVVVK